MKKEFNAVISEVPVFISPNRMTNDQCRFFDPVGKDVKAVSMFLPEGISYQDLLAFSHRKVKITIELESW